MPTMDLKSVLITASAVAAGTAAVLAVVELATQEDVIAAAVAAVALSLLFGAAGLLGHMRSAADNQSLLLDARAQARDLTAAVQLAVQHLSSLEFAHDATSRGVAQLGLAAEETGRRLEGLEAAAAELSDIGRQSQASLDVVAPSVEGLRSAVDARMGNIEDSLMSFDEALAGLGERHKAVADATVSVSTALDKAVAELFRRHHEARQHRETLYAQLEALSALYAYLQPRTGLPPFRNWAVSPDLARNLIEFVTRAGPNLAVELGSGTSTVLVAMALANQGRGKLVSVEHDPFYANKTQEMLDAAGVSTWAQIVDAPLGEIDFEGNSMVWYDLAKLDLDRPIDLLLVDGPPGITGPLARLPAAILFDQMADGGVVVLDDTNRETEREIVDRWAQLPGVEIIEDQQLEKGATWLRVSRHQ